MTPAQRQREALVFGLRLLEGVSLNGSWDQSVDQRDRKLRQLEQAGLLEREADRIRLTELGRRFADQVAVELL
ncbi:MAG: hypothetical protein ACKOCD_11165 [Nitrospiraceae bacterium]